MKALRFVLPFSCFNGLTQTCFVKTFLTHNKHLTFWFLEDNVPISAKSAEQILSLNLAKALPFLDFLITSLCNSSASSSFTLAPYPAFFFFGEKTDRPYLLMPFDFHHIFDF